MAPASPSLPSDSSRSKWRKRKRESNLGGRNSVPTKPKPHEDDEDEDEEEEEANAAGEDDDNELSANPQADAVIDLRQAEVLSDGGQRISDFPLVIRRSVNRPHPSVLGIVAAERWVSGQTRPKMLICLENISHGQLQALSAVLPDHPSLNHGQEMDRPPAYVCTPPPLMEGKGVVKRFGNDSVLVVPVHSDWFNPITVHRLERQVVPHYFSGKSADHTPEKYIVLRNRIVAKYLENPGRKLSFGECQGLVSNNANLYDLSRIVRFLDHWGIINYIGIPGNRGPTIGGSLIREETNGEIQVTTAPLKSIDSLVLFDRPRSSYRPEDVASLSPSVSTGSGGEAIDLDSRIRERLSEHSCSNCSRPLLRIHYQSQKEADTVLCSDCFHDAKFIVGHSSLDFVKMDYTKDTYDIDGESWTDQETFFLLEALEIYNDNWNEIAEHVGTKTKAQCILHFIRLPMEDGLLENIEFPPISLSPEASKGSSNGILDANYNGDHAGLPAHDDNYDNHLPFENAANPVMSLVAFLASTIGPRVAATCASAALSVLTKNDSRSDWINTDGTHAEAEPPADHTNLEHHKDNMENQGLNGGSDSASGSLSADRVKYAAMLGLSAAAIKTKLFADQEEREIQRLSATIINHQLKRLELKLKQFAEVETMLLKECEQVERSRQRLLAERIRIVSSRFGQAGSATIPAPAQAAVAPAADMNANTRQPGISIGGQTNIPPAAYANNVPNHPHMPFMQHQSVFPFVGPRLPLSAIHPSSAPQSTNVLLPSGMSNATATNLHPLLRSLSGNNNNLS